MTQTPDILCIGSVLWDIIGRAPRAMQKGNDVGGRIRQIPGGVALNIAMTLMQFDLRPALLSAVGRDASGDHLIADISQMGLICDHLYRPNDLPTDRYMAIEDVNGLIAAIADAHSLEAAGERILQPLCDGTLGSANAPYKGLIALDGNLTTELLDHIAQAPEFAAADLRVAPASPGKAERLMPFLSQSRATLYVNLEEAGLLCNRAFGNAAEAVQGLLDQGAMRALVTDGGNIAAEGDASGLRCASPPPVEIARVTGAGDTFMAAHISAQRQGAAPQAALQSALNAAARYVSGEDPE